MFRSEWETCFISEGMDTSEAIYTLVAGELNKESNCGRDTPIVDRRGPSMTWTAMLSTMDDMANLNSFSLTMKSGNRLVVLSRGQSEKS